jgi:formyl-CoA transferase/CoA:oxalate CoA-transferase
MIQEIKTDSGKVSKHVAFPIKLSETPAELHSPPPALGEHTEEVLLEAGYSREEIEKFKQEGAI